jgi:hypothetical protein
MQSDGNIKLVMLFITNDNGLYVVALLFRAQCIMQVLSRSRTFLHESCIQIVEVSVVQEAFVLSRPCRSATEKVTSSMHFEVISPAPRSDSLTSGRVYGDRHRPFYKLVKMHFLAGF